MKHKLPKSWLNLLVGCVVAFGSSAVANAQLKVISADNLTPFQPRDVGTTSDAKTVRIKLNYARVISSIAVAPGTTEFTSGAVSGCVVDGHTINPALSACSVDVTFSPKSPGLRTAPLVMTDGSGTKSSVGLVGIGLAPQAALTPGIITTIAGTGTPGQYGEGDGGPATAAELYNPHFVKFDWAGNLYISDLILVRKIDTNGIITTVAGNGGFGLSGIGGPATRANLGHVIGLALDAASNIYFTTIDTGTYVLKVDLNGILTIFAGTGPLGFSGDGGPATQAAISGNAGLAIDVAGNVYIADYYNARIRKVDTKGIITTVVGNGCQCYGGDGGPATEAEIYFPQDVTVDAAGNLYIADSYNQRIRKVDNATGIITTIAGNGYVSDSWNHLGGFSGDGGPAVQAELSKPSALAVDSAGNVYIADAANNRIRRVDTNGIIQTIAGTGSSQYSGDGGPVTAAGLSTWGLTMGPSGGFIMADIGNNRIRKVDVSQSAINFSSQNVGTVSPSKQITVINTGNQHIEFTELSLTGDFVQKMGNRGDSPDCSSIGLGAGFSCAIRITFAPTAVGTLTGFATVTDNSQSLPGTTQLITLSGTGTAP